MTSPEAEPGLERFGFWTTSPSGRVEFPKPGGDTPGTPLFDALWDELMGKHSDRDHSGVADFAEEEARKGEIQSAVFRESTEKDWVDDDDLAEMAKSRQLTFHQPEGN